MSSVIHVINLHVGPIVCTMVIQEAVLGDFVLVDQRGRGSNAHVVLHDVDIIIMRAHYDAAVIIILDHLQLLGLIRVLLIDDNLVIFPGGLILGSFFWVLIFPRILLVSRVYRLLACSLFIAPPGC